MRMCHWLKGRVPEDGRRKRLAEGELARLEEGCLNGRKGVAEPVDEGLAGFAIRIDKATTDG